MVNRRFLSYARSSVQNPESSSRRMLWENYKDRICASIGAFDGVGREEKAPRQQTDTGLAAPEDDGSFARCLSGRCLRLMAGWISA